jgi:hypothetical protein
VPDEVASRIELRTMMPASDLKPWSLMVNANMEGQHHIERNQQAGEPWLEADSDASLGMSGARRI